MEYVFEIFDADKDGFISLRDMIQTMGTLYINEGLAPSLALERAVLVFSVFQNDQNSLISLKKFIKTCKENRDLMDNINLN